MKIAIITDQHFGARKNSKLFHDYFLKFYEDIFFPTLIKEETLHLLDDKDNPIDITLEKAKTCLQLRHALTVHKSQSKTIEGHVRICPGKAPGHVSPYWSLRHLLVAASRARSIQLLSIE